MVKISVEQKMRYANASERKGAYDDARRTYRAILEVFPNNARARKALKNLETGMGIRPDGGLTRSDPSMTAQPVPSNPDHFIRQGRELNNRGEFESAIRSFRRALEIERNSYDANLQLGIALKFHDKAEEALACFQRAAEIRPEAVDPHLLSGLLLKEVKQFDRAIGSFRMALRIQPDLFPAHYGLGIALMYQCDFEEAQQCFEQALKLNPKSAEVLVSLGSAHMEQSRFEAAAAHYHQALAIDPDNAEAHFSLSCMKLMLGDFANGWPEYEWRKKKAKPYGNRDLPAPLWLGQEELRGKSIFLHSEQGLGDTIQFSRYAELARNLGAKVTVSVQNSLLPLLEGAVPGVEVIAANAAPKSFDYHCPLMSLPLAFGTSPDTIPSRPSYLKPDPSRVRKWSDHLGADGFKIGICWQGSTADIDRGRSFPVTELRGIGKLPDVRLISLHKGAGESQLHSLPDGMAVETLGEAFDPPEAAFLDTAAVIELCDLVITCDTAVAHLAGALGAPVWVALKHVPDWRWMLNRTDSPWYPSMRLFRQERAEDWRGVFIRIEEALAELLKSREPHDISGPREKAITRTTHMPLIPVSWGEVIDKITILEIKCSRMTDETALANVRLELDKLNDVSDSHLKKTNEIISLQNELREVNERLWDIEEKIRYLDLKKSFGDEFIQLARSVYKNNDIRSNIKRRISEITSSLIVEEKSY